MTALKGYQRLECAGVWRASPEHQRKDVVVCVGDATLVMYDYADNPLTHWSLPALVRLNGNAKPAIFAPGAGSTEELEISDDSMIHALEQVRKVVSGHGPRNRRPWAKVIAGITCVLLALCIIWFPEILAIHSASMVPEAKRDEFGKRLLAHIQRTSGHPCHTPSGTAALGRLYTRLLDDRPGRLVVLPNGTAQTLHLPGGLLLVDPALIEDHDSPDVVAGHLIAEAIRADGQDPITRMLEQAGALAALRMLTTGDLPEDALIEQARTLLSQQSEPVSLEVLLERFREAELSAIPYANAVDRFDEVTQRLAQHGPGRELPVLSDADWVSLQRICGK